MIRQLIIGVCLYCIFLVFLFPYQSVVDHAFHRFESATGAQVTYTPVSAGPFGVQLRDLNILMPSGLQASFNSVVMHPGFGTLSANFSQSGVHSTFNLKGSALTLHLEKTEFISGSAELGKIRATGDLNYNLVKKDGEGDLRLEIPKFQGPLPIPEMAIDLGTNLSLVDHGLGMEVAAEVHTVSGQEFSADGSIKVTPQAGQPVASLSGTLNYRIPFKKGILRLEGTWRKPNWSLVSSP